VRISKIIDLSPNRVIGAAHSRGAATRVKRGRPFLPGPAGRRRVADLGDRRNLVCLAGKQAKEAVDRRSPSTPAFSSAPWSATTKYRPRPPLRCSEAEIIAVSLSCLCEFVWVLRRVYDFGQRDISAARVALLDAANVAVNRPAADAGLAVFNAGRDFTDGVIAYEGGWLGGDTFVSFDKKEGCRVDRWAGSNGEVAGLVNQF
jgi:predicted nucleic-acid-binding protein